MKKILLLILLVLILVSISWFRPAFCNNNVDDSLINAYLKSAASSNIENRPTATYSSPQYFSSEEYRGAASDSTSMTFQSPTSGPMPDSSSRKISTGLRPFGYDLFNSPNELSRPIDVAAASDYILGPGDNVIINIWGRVEKEYNLTIDRQGNVFIPKVGATTAWGMTIADFSSQIEKKLSQVYTDFKISVSLGAIRSIRVYLTGEVKKPGAYTVSSLTTLFNALYLAGGPNERGSLRNIRLIRNNRLEKTVDIYDFLLKGNTEGDIRLASGDAIFVPVSGPRVTISGEVKRPAIYELSDVETVEQLIELAGGTTAEAYLDRIMLNRISEDNKKIVLDVNLNPLQAGSPPDICLADGDRVTVFSVFDVHRNVVKIGGMVQHPGTYERTDSTTVATLITRGELRPENVYLERANIFRKYPDRRIEIIPFNLKEVLSGQADYSLKDLDSLHIYSIDEIEWKKYVYIDGEIKNPGQYELYDGMTVYDLIFLAGNLKRNAYKYRVELARTDTAGSITTQVIDITDDNMRQIGLEEDDRVFIREFPDWFLHRLVNIEGEVRFPGRYSLLSGEETLYQLLNRAGGFTERAFPRGLVLQRKSIGNDLIRQNIPEIIINSQPLVEDSTGNVRRLETGSFDPHKMNRIIVDVEKILATGGREGDIRLQKDDYIYVPDMPSGVSVIGAVASNGTIKYEPGRSVDYYVRQAGNFTGQAEKSGTKLIKANGQVFAHNGTLRKKVDVGDVIFVPTEIKKQRDWLKSASTVATILGGVLTSVLIIDRL